MRKWKWHFALKMVQILLKNWKILIPSSHYSGPIVQSISSLSASCWYTVSVGVNSAWCCNSPKVWQSPCQSSGRSRGWSSALIRMSSTSLQQSFPLRSLPCLFIWAWIGRGPPAAIQVNNDWLESILRIWLEPIKGKVGKGVQGNGARAESFVKGPN